MEKLLGSLSGFIFIRLAQKGAADQAFCLSLLWLFKAATMLIQSARTGWALVLLMIGVMGGMTGSSVNYCR